MSFLTLGFFNVSGSSMSFLTLGLFNVSITISLMSLYSALRCSVGKDWVEGVYSRGGWGEEEGRLFLPGLPVTASLQAAALLDRLRHPVGRVVYKVVLHHAGWTWTLEKRFQADNPIK